MDSDFERKFITTKEASKLTGYSSDYIGQMSRKGFFDSTKVGRKLYVNRAEILAYKEKNKPGVREALQQAELVSESEKTTPETSEDTFEPILNNTTFSREKPFHEESFKETITPTDDVIVNEEEKISKLGYPSVLAGVFATMFLIVGVSSISFALKDVSLEDFGVDMVFGGTESAKSLLAVPSINLKYYFNRFFAANEKEETDQLNQLFADPNLLDVTDGDELALEEDEIDVTDEGEDPVSEVQTPTAPRGRSPLASGTLEINVDLAATENVTVSGTTRTGGLVVSGNTTIFGLLNSNGGIITNGQNVDAGSGQVFGSNIINTLVEGSGITITGTKQDPIISSRQSRILFGGGGSNGTDGAAGADGADGATTFLALTDAQDSFTTNRIIHTNSAGTALTDTAGFVFDGINLGVGTSSPYAPISIWVSTTSSGSTAFEITDNASTTVLSVTDQGVLAITGTLSVSSTTATSTFSHGIDIASGCFSFAGNCIGGAAATSYLILSDTPSSFSTSSIPFVNSGSSALTQSVDFVFNGTNLGIGTSSPLAKLSVHGLSTDATSTQPLFIVATSTQTATTTVFIIDYEGNVGIGTSTPGATLAVGGDILGNIISGANFIATSTATSTFAGAIDVTESNATSTFAHGIDVATGCLAVNGTCIVSGDATAIKQT